MPGTMLTQAANRESTRLRAIFSASSALDAVLNTTILSVIFDLCSWNLHPMVLFIFRALLHEIQSGKNQLYGCSSGSRQLCIGHVAWRCSGINPETERYSHAGKGKRRP